MAFLEDFEAFWPLGDDYFCACRKAEGNSGSDGFNNLEVAGNDANNVDAALAEQFNRFAKAIMSQDEKMAEQVIEEMG